MSGNHEHIILEIGTKNSYFLHEGLWLPIGVEAFCLGCGLGLLVVVFSLGGFLLFFSTKLQDLAGIL